MWLTIFLVLGLEVLAISTFLLGHTLGRQFERNFKCKVKLPPPINLPDDVLDPITPEEQMLVRKLDEEAKKHGPISEDEEDQ